MKLSLTALKKLYALLAVLVLGLIALGGATRAMNAGLACPDWPLCFGKVIPDFQTQVYFEFIHRALAGSISLLSLFLGICVFRSAELPRRARIFVVISWVVLIVQIIMGALTVLKLLNFGTVTAHLAFGMTFFGVNVWLLFVINNPHLLKAQRRKQAIKYFIHGAPLIVFMQILLGGLVSSNYAGLACPDFPLCNGQLIPTFAGTVGLQVMHRLGAYTVFVYIYLLNMSLQWGGWKVPIKVTKSCRMAMSMVLVQLAIGMANVLFKLPPVVTVLHLVIAASIFATTLRMVFLMSYEPDPGTGA